MLAISGFQRRRYACLDDAATVLWQLAESAQTKSGQHRLGHSVIAVACQRWIEDCNINHASVVHLTAANWRQLQHLGLNCNCLTAADICHLSKANWPHLRSLHLEGTFCNSVRRINGSILQADSFDEPLSPIFMQSLISASWLQLETLDLSHCKLQAAEMAQLQLSCWPLLQELDLSGNVLSSEGFASLSAVEWPKLQSLNLADTNIGAVGMSHLALARLPSLTALDLSRNLCLDSHVIARLVKAQWVSTIQKLNLHDNWADTETAEELVKGTWPALKVLDIVSEEFECEAAEVLLSGKWPCLECLEVAGKFCADEAFHSSAGQYVCDLIRGGDVCEGCLGVLPGANYLGSYHRGLGGVWSRLQVLYISTVNEPSQSLAWDCRSKKWWEL